jgi:hypothetical protein
MAVTKQKFSTLHDTLIVDDNKGRYSRIFQYGEHKFKMAYRLENGVSDLSLYKMTIQGDWALVMTNFNFGHVFSCSYLQKAEMKHNDIKTADRLVERVVSKIWAIEK